MPEESCNLDDLAAEAAGNGLNSMDAADTQAAIAYMLALTIKNLDPRAPDYTDICALAKSLQAHDNLPDYARNAARLEAWSEITENTSAQELDWDQLRSAIKCAHCCDITQKSIENAITFMLCKLSVLIQPV